VNVQASQWNHGRDGRFTLNLGVYFPKVAERRGIPAKSAYPKEHESTLRTRIGALMPESPDHWWDIRDGADMRALSVEVVHAYVTFAEPWLTDMTTLENVLPRLRNGNPFMAVVAALELNRRDEAREIVCQLLRQATPGLASTVRRFAERQGIDGLVA
jgi:hypothetical protein